MNKHHLAIALIAIALGSCGPTYVVHNSPPPPPPVSDPAPEVTYQTFYDNLSPYGQWIDYPEYGYVWMPDSGPDFKPYATNGQWVYTEDGWTWSSGYPWGWATFHYGRWFFDPNYGWMWIPGYQWAPAWVSWRQSPDYYGWAPLGPDVTVGVAVSSYNPPANYWCFVPHQYVTSPAVSTYYVNETRNVTIINNTTVVNNTYVVNNRLNSTNVNNNIRNNYVLGPDPREVSRYTGTTVTPAVVRQSSSPGERLGNGQLSLYRPKVAAAPSTVASTGSSRQRPAPARVVPLTSVRPVTNRPPASQAAATSTNSSESTHQNDASIRQQTNTNANNGATNTNTELNRNNTSATRQQTNVNAGNAGTNNQINRNPNNNPPPNTNGRQQDQNMNNSTNASSTNSQHQRPVTSNTTSATTNNANQNPNNNQVNRSQQTQNPSNHSNGQQPNKKPQKPKKKRKDSDKDNSQKG